MHRLQPLLLGAIVISLAQPCQADRKPATLLPGVITEFTLRSGSVPWNLAAAPDGSIWYTEQRWEEIGKLASSGVIATYPFPISRPTGIIVGADANIWFCRFFPAQIVKMSPSGAILETYEFRDAHSAPQVITTGLDGNLWVGIKNGIARVTPTGAITEFPIPTTDVTGIAAGPDGNVWFVTNQSDSVGKITPSGQYTLFPFPGIFRGASGIIAGPDGNLWLTESYADQVARVTPEGAITEYPLGYAGPVGIALGGDGNLWVTASTASRVLRLRTDGTVTGEVMTPVPSAPARLIAGPNGTLWFLETTAPPRLARLTLSTTPVTLQRFSAE